YELSQLGIAEPRLGQSEVVSYQQLEPVHDANVTPGAVVKRVSGEVGERCSGLGVRLSRRTCAFKRSAPRVVAPCCPAVEAGTHSYLPKELGAIIAEFLLRYQVDAQPACK